MAIDFILPELGENIETIQVANILVKVGDAVDADQPMLELETDKATIEVPANDPGTIAEILVAVGDDVEVGQAILRFGEGGAAPAEAAAPVEPANAPEASDVVPAASDLSPAPPAPAPQTPPAPVAEPAAAASPGDQVPAAPSVRKFAREIGMALGNVPATGPAGRVSIEDVKRYAKGINEGRSVTATTAGITAPSLPPLPDFTSFGDVEAERMSAIRFKTASHMALSWSQIPHVTIFDEADITELEPLRKRYADRAIAAGGKLTMAVMVCKIVASALKQFPKFNASIDMQTKTVFMKRFVNLGVAVATPKGLMVPVIPDADRKNMVELAVAIGEVATKAREGRIAMEDLQGGTFTITNLGRVGGTHFTPIVNYPEVAILGMGRSHQVAATDGSGNARTMLPLSLSFDHRIIDGSDAAAFLGWILEALHEPLVLALEG